MEIITAPFQYVYDWVFSSTPVPLEKDPVAKSSDCVTFVKIVDVSPEELKVKLNSLKPVEPNSFSLSENKVLKDISFSSREDLLSNKRNSVKITDDQTLSNEEKKEKIKLFFQQKRLQRQKEMEMQKIISDPKLRRENKEMISQYLKNE